MSSVWILISVEYVLGNRYKKSDACCSKEEYSRLRSASNWNYYLARWINAFFPYSFSQRTESLINVLNLNLDILSFSVMRCFSSCSSVPLHWLTWRWFPWYWYWTERSHWSGSRVATAIREQYNRCSLLVPPYPPLVLTPRNMWMRKCKQRHSGKTGCNYEITWNNNWWQPQLELPHWKTNQNIAFGIGAMKCVRHLVPPPTLHLIYQALIQPHFDYCCTIWGTCGVTLQDKLQKLQNRATLVLTFSIYDVNAANCWKSWGGKILTASETYKRSPWYSNAYMG